MLLAESHLSIHTWPDSGFVSLDVFVSNDQEDNTWKGVWLFKTLKSLFRPAREHLSEVKRGGPHLVLRGI